jgi:hypothetical protein
MKKSHLGLFLLAYASTITVILSEPPIVPPALREMAAEGRIQEIEERYDSNSSTLICIKTFFNLAPFEMKSVACRLEKASPSILNKGLVPVEDPLSRGIIVLPNQRFIYDVATGKWVEVPPTNRGKIDGARLLNCVAQTNPFYKWSAENLEKDYKRIGLMNPVAATKLLWPLKALLAAAPGPLSFASDEGLIEYKFDFLPNNLVAP